ncbi:MAG: hypothetical protein AB1505_29795 [Candidatus Latescibacterota bacterium]
MSTMTEDQIRRFAAAWYRALDNHDPIEDCYGLLAEKDLDMQFPDGDIRDYESFRRWYDRVTHLFFDENHYVQSVNARVSGDQAEVDVVVGWQASWWEPPAAKSKRVSMDATQKWIVRRSTRNPYGLEIVSYNATAEPFKYAPGFARL